MTLSGVLSTIKPLPMIIIKALMTRSAALIAAALAGVIDAISHSESFHKHSIGISGKFVGRTTVLNHGKIVFSLFS